MTKSPLTTHALDTSLGKPAAGLEVVLLRIWSENEATLITSKVCDKDGRVNDMMSDSQLWIPGTYRLRFATGKYYDRQGQKSFYPHVDVTFNIENLSEHYHVPLLLSPFGYSTYRGS
ncbi:unnamed protein product [Agarophyton chilense]